MRAKHYFAYGYGNRAWFATPAERERTTPTRLRSLYLDKIPGPGLRVHLIYMQPHACIHTLAYRSENSTHHIHHAHILGILVLAQGSNKMQMRVHMMSVYSSCFYPVIKSGVRCIISREKIYGLTNAELQACHFYLPEIDVERKGSR